VICYSNKPYVNLNTNTTQSPLLLYYTILYYYIYNIFNSNQRKQSNQRNSKSKSKNDDKDDKDDIDDKDGKNKNIYTTIKMTIHR
jgi:hypothetical protein